MRVWDLPPSKLCDRHLLGQHREIHAIYTILTEDKKGYRNHPEVKRWVGHLYALRITHHNTVMSMLFRGMSHYSTIEGTRLTYDSCLPPDQWQTTEQQIEILKAKDCGCYERLGNGSKTAGNSAND